MQPEPEAEWGKPPSLADAPWLAAAATQAVLGALRNAGHEGRIVGGTVRNALLGLPVSDVDVATVAVPEAVVVACRAAGLTTVATGIEHGTVTVIAHHTPVEVTTLRRDVATDGRRAVVAFTTNWAEDAERRDFTINALYCDADGRVYDYVGGYADLVARRVRFIGDADQRIAEDYLRILRFFRFFAAYAEGDPDKVAMAAAARGLAGMSRLSAERIRAELVKLLVAPRVAAAVRAMADIGLLSFVLGAAPRPGVFERMIAAEAAAGEPPDPMLRLSALAIACEDDIPRIASRLRLSNDERAAQLVAGHEQMRALGVIDERRARRLVYERGADAVRRVALALRAVEPVREGEAAILVAVAKSWTPPRLPVSGKDVIALGFTAGPEVGRVLGALERWWCDADFPDEAATRARLAALAAAAKG